MKRKILFSFLILTIHFIQAQTFIKEIDVPGRSEFCIATDTLNGEYFCLINSFDYSQLDYRQNSHSILFLLDKQGKTSDSLFFNEPDSNILWTTIRVLSDQTLLLSGELFCNSDTARLILRRYSPDLIELETKILGSDKTSYLISGITETSTSLVLTGGLLRSSTLICLDKQLDFKFEHIISNPGPYSTFSGNYHPILLNDSVLLYHSWANQLDSTSSYYALWMLNINSTKIEELIHFNSHTNIPALMNDSQIGIYDIIDNLADDTLVNGIQDYYSDIRFRQFDLTSKTFVSDSTPVLIGSSESLVVSHAIAGLHYTLFNQHSLLFQASDFYSNAGILVYNESGHLVSRVIIPWSKPFQSMTITGTKGHLIIGGVLNFVYTTRTQNQTSALIIGFDQNLKSIPNALGTQSFPKKSLLKIYPNPSSGKINLSLPEKAIIHSITILDQTGKIVLKSSEFDSIQLPEKNGMYRIDVVLQDGRHFSESVLVVR